MKKMNEKEDIKRDSEKVVTDKLNISVVNDQLPVVSKDKITIPTLPIGPKTLRKSEHLFYDRNHKGHILKKSDEHPESEEVKVCEALSNMTEDKKVEEGGADTKSKKKRGKKPSKTKQSKYVDNKFHRLALKELNKKKQSTKQAEERRQQRRLIKTPRNITQRKELRQKFVNQALSYIGTPYSKKYHNLRHPKSESNAPESSFTEEYNGLYLDCCGLIRQVLKDLRNDFGFIPGDWNQVQISKR